MCKVLVIEDNPVNLFLYKEVLENIGRHEVIMSSDGMDVPDIVLKNQPHIVILDIQLPKKSGFDVYEEIKVKCSDLLAKIPVMFVSADMSSGEMAERAGISRDRCMTKPFDFRVLLAKVESLSQICSKPENKALLNYGK